MLNVNSQPKGQLHLAPLVYMFYILLSILILILILILTHMSTYSQVNQTYVFLHVSKFHSPKHTSRSSEKFINLKPTHDAIIFTCYCHLSCELAHRSLMFGLTLSQFTSPLDIIVMSISILSMCVPLSNATVLACHYSMLQHCLCNTSHKTCYTLMKMPLHVYIE